MDELDQLVTRHRQLVEMIVAERNRRMSLGGSAQNDIEVTIRFLQGRLKQVDERLKTLIEKDPEWNRRAALLNSVPGVGPVLISSLIAELPPLPPDLIDVHRGQQLSPHLAGRRRCDLT